MESEENLWSIPELWPNSTVFIIGGGRSLLNQDLSLIHNQHVIGVNYGFTLGSWVDVCWFGDRLFYDIEHEKLANYKGLIITCAPGDFPSEIKQVGRSKIDGIESQKRTHIAWCGNSGASAINLAYWLGAKTFVLLGFDMQYSTVDRDHWYSGYLPTTKRKRLYRGFLRRFPEIKAEAEQLRIEIINATIGGSLNIFKRKTLEEICQDL